MSELPDLTSKEDLRKYALDYIEKTFREKLDAFTGDDKDREVSEDVKAKFEQVGSFGFMTILFQGLKSANFRHFTTSYRPVSTLSSRKNCRKIRKDRQSIERIRKTTRRIKICQSMTNNYRYCQKLYNKMQIFQSVVT